MFFNSGLFWFFMGMITILIGFGFRAFAHDRGWHLSWWKWSLSILWYAVFSLSILSYGTLTGEREDSAGLKMLILGLFICTVYGVGLWRLFSRKTGTDNTPDA
jgi:hypothetical protein